MHVYTVLPCLFYGIFIHNNIVVEIRRKRESWRKRGEMWKGQGKCEKKERKRIKKKKGVLGILEKRNSKEINHFSKDASRKKKTQLERRKKIFCFWSYLDKLKIRQKFFEFLKKIFFRVTSFELRFFSFESRLSNCVFRDVSFELRFSRIPRTKKGGEKMWKEKKWEKEKRR